MSRQVQLPMWHYTYRSLGCLLFMNQACHYQLKPSRLPHVYTDVRTRRCTTPSGADVWMFHFLKGW